MASDLYLLRHGETAWSLSGQHTGLTEVPLTPHGEEEARRLGAEIRGLKWDRVFTSPRLRARRTCELAGLAQAEVCDDLHEWMYGDYEGLLLEEIRERHPGWDIFKDGCPRGESPDHVSARADRVLRMIGGLDGPVAVVSHGHFSRVLALRWTRLPLIHGSLFDSSTASLSHLGIFKKTGQPLIKLWNKK